jgi:hypothetical protein
MTQDRSILDADPAQVLDPARLGLKDLLCQRLHRMSHWLSFSSILPVFTLGSLQQWVPIRTTDEPAEGAC